MRKTVKSEADERNSSFFASKALRNHLRKGRRRGTVDEEERKNMRKKNQHNETPANLVRATKLRTPRRETFHLSRSKAIILVDIVNNYLQFYKDRMRGVL